jgi:hypothetical protein
VQAGPKARRLRTHGDVRRFLAPRRLARWSLATAVVATTVGIGAVCAIPARLVVEAVGVIEVAAGCPSLRQGLRFPIEMSRTVEEIIPLLRALPSEALDAFYHLAASYRPGRGIDLHAWGVDLARRRGFDHLTEDDVAALVHEHRRSA